MFTNFSGERSFSRLKKIINDIKGRNVSGRLHTLSIQCIESHKIRQTNFNESLDDFVMKKARTKPLLCSIQKYQYHEAKPTPPKTVLATCLNNSTYGIHLNF